MDTSVHNTVTTSNEETFLQDSEYIWKGSLLYGNYSWKGSVYSGKGSIYSGKGSIYIFSPRYYSAGTYDSWGLYQCVMDIYIYMRVCVYTCGVEPLTVPTMLKRSLCSRCTLGTWNLYQVQINCNRTVQLQLHNHVAINWRATFSFVVIVNIIINLLSIIVINYGICNW